jgi:hypothetical protein
MPKGVQNTNPEIIERLKSKIAQSLSFSLNTNKNYDLLSNIIFERTGAILSNSTLRRVFQYDCDNHPTKSTLDLICKAIGFRSWDDFIEKESNQVLFDISQLIAMYKLQGLGDHTLTWQTIEKQAEHPNFFTLLDAIVQIAISNRDIEFLSKLFELEGVFDRSHSKITIIYFIHNLVIGLNQSGLMPELVGYYGANPKAQIYLVEWFVDEDNLNGYYYELLQVYHQHKTTPEALLFYNCLMYQRAIRNNLPTSPWLDFIHQFEYTSHVHNIPVGRWYAILMFETSNSSEAIADILNKTRELFHYLSETERITTALYMVKLLFLKPEDNLIDKVLALAPDINDAGKNVDDRININQIKIYRAYSLYQKGEKENAAHKLNEFDPLLVQAFIYNQIMDDYKVISAMIRNES